MMSNGVFILLAGGSSSRMGGDKKELLPLPEGDNALSRLSQMLEQGKLIKHLHVVYAPMHEEAIRQAVALFTGRITFSPAGTTRQASVWQALEQLSAYAPQWVMIHDGARPWLTHQLIERLHEGLAQHEALLPIIPLTDSLKRLDAEGVVVEECDRRSYGLAQTPQAFHFDAIYQAHKALQRGNFSDDTSIYHAHHGRHAQSILGEIGNKKLTYREDLA
ncbi:IspD/TarI family cytidylyltransferase [Entomospira culicis]|nr:IspD/TarI family cytidylyltransferase [Entomospira culicis]